MRKSVTRKRLACLLIPFQLEYETMTVETGDALDDGAVVGRHVDAKQLVEGGHRVVLVDPPGGATVANVVLRARSHVALAGDERGA